MIHKMKDYDFTLMITPILLAAFGIVMIYSSSMVIAVVEGLGSTYYLFKQLQWFIIGLIGFAFCCVFPYRHYQRMIKMIVLFSIILLIGVLLYGEEANNATRSLILFGSISIQPSEFIKLGLILYLASVYSKKQEYITEFSKAVLPLLVLKGFILGLILLQPDIVTAATIFLFVCAIIVSSAINYKQLFIIIGINVTLFIITLPYMITDVRIARFTGAYKTFTTSETGGYHLIQSYLEIGVGCLTGEGL